ncbi:hypothetical protein IC582_007720 [Cucumis melo]
MNERKEEHTDRQGEEEKRGSNWEEEDGRIDVLKAVNRSVDGGDNGSVEV